MRIKRGTRSSGVFVVVVLVVVTSACARGRFGPSLRGTMKTSPRTLKQLTVAERSSILRRAQIWQAVDTPALDLLSGPRGEDAYEFNQTVTCRFVFPDGPLSGATSKFRCALGPEDFVKVKYGRKNGEVYAEVAATRLFWALGFAADRWYPVQLICQGCPENPWTPSKLEWFKGPPRFVADRPFEVAAIERDHEGTPIETPGFQGWAWPELEHVDEQVGGAPRAHVDALKLAAVFLQHTDTKPEQQELVCLPGNIRRDEAGNETCASARLVVKDLGTTFSQARQRNFSKMDLAKWQESPIWLERSGSGCVGNLLRSYTGNLENPTIGDEGRRFLGERLSLLSDRQIRDLFTAARVERRGATIRGEDNVSRPVTVEDWVRVFKRKRAEIVNHRCAA